MLFLSICLFGTHGRAVVLRSPSDPAPMYSVYGANKTGTHKKKNHLEFITSPYYQHSYKALNKERKGVPLGDMHGRANMLGLLLGFKNSAGSAYLNDKYKLDDATNNTVLHKAYENIYVVTDGKKYLDKKDMSADPGYQDLNKKEGHLSSLLDYERVGVRGMVNYSLDAGLGFCLKGGVAQYRVKPVYTANPETELTGDLLDAINNNLMTSVQIRKIEKELNIKILGEIEESGFEDASAELYWRRPYKLKDSEGDLVALAIPYIGVGAIIPVADKKVSGSTWSQSLGNNGFYGITGTVEVAFDFPGMVKISVGGTGTFFEEQDMGLQHVPTSQYQQILYPWKTTVTKRLGNQWKVYGAMRANQFVENMNAYFDFQYIINERDKVTLTGKDKAFFLPQKLADESYSDAQLFSFGLDYEITEHLKFGFAVQSLFTGKHAWKTTTVLGSLDFIF